MRKKTKKEPSWDEIGKAIGTKMEKECKDDKFKSWKIKGHMHGGGSAVYGLGFIGALIYYITTATSIWVAVLGIFKALLWPAFMVYGLLKFLGM